MAAKCEEFYCRRGDRAPEKPEFFKLPQEDRQLICQLRSAISVAKDKVTLLRDESEDKDRDICREAALRKAAETRLEQMVDMYGDPAVTEELRRRLPRAGRTDPKVRLQRELEEMGQASLTSTGPDGGKARRNLAAELEDRGRKSRSLSADSLNSRRHDDSVGRSNRRNRSHSPPERTRDYHRESPRDHGYHPGYPAAYPGGPYPGGTYGPHPAFYPPMYHTLPASMYPSTTGMVPQGASPGIPMAQSTPAKFTPQLGGVYLIAPPTGAPSGYAPHNAAGQPVVTTNCANVTPPQQVGVTTTEAGSAVKDSVVGVTSSLGGGATTGIDSSAGGANSIKVVTINREQQRQISLLLAELDASKDLNKQLQTKLTSSDKELGSLRIAVKTQEAALGVGKSDKIAELVEEIYRAQKTRDESMLGRLRVANEDRDEALLKLKRLRASAHHGVDSEKESPLTDYTDGWERLTDAGGHLVEKISSRRQRREEISTEEMRVVLQDRDSTVAKCRQLEAEVVKLQRLSRVRGSDKQNVSTMQAKLLATQQERDLALSRMRKLEDELQTLRVYYSLHKSLSQEANLRDQFNNTLKNIEVAVKDRDSTIEVAKMERGQLLGQLKMVMAEKEALSEQLEKSEAGQKEAQANCHKLERLVNVLRRKINGLGTKLDD